MNWTNYDNIDFYNNISPEELKKFAAIAGLNSNCDLELIKPFLKSTDLILEVGAGYGRILDFLSTHNFKKIFAVERSKQFYRLLKDHYVRKVKLFYIDIHFFECSEKFNHILWLWSGIADFAKHEQGDIVNLLVKKLKPGGKLFIDSTIPDHRPLHAIYANKQEYTIELEGNPIMVYCASVEEITKYALTANIKKIEHINYITSTNRHRILSILTR